MNRTFLTSFEQVFNTLNMDERHYENRNDICTPMECVQEMVEAIPKTFWQRTNLRVLDPCAGNGNFHAYIQRYRKLKNLVFNEINPKRIANIRRLFGKNAIITKRDFLEYDESERFDLIVANPPYAKFDTDGNRVSKNHNLSRAFIAKAIKLLNENGMLLFIVPDNWMSLADRNPLPSILSRHQFLHLNIHGAKNYFQKVGSSFTWFLLQKKPNHKPFRVENNYIWRDRVLSSITPGASYVPLYFNDVVRRLFAKCIDTDNEKHGIDTNCDLHRYTHRDIIGSKPDKLHPYRLIHTPKQTVWSSRPHKYQNGWKVFLSLSDHYNTFVDDCGMTQSIAYIRCNSKREAMERKRELDAPLYRFLNDFTRYGNFNNIRILRRLPRLHSIKLTREERNLIDQYQKVLQSRVRRVETGNDRASEQHQMVLQCPGA